MANDKKISSERYKFSAQRDRYILDDVRSKLIKSMEYSKSGKDDEAEAIRQEIIDSLQDKIEQYERDISCTVQHHTNFDISVLPEKSCILNKNDMIELRTVSEQDFENFMAVSYENSAMKSAFKDDAFKMAMWETHISEKTANYSIFDKTSGEYVGYCGIKNLTQDSWEIAVELLKKFQGKGYGYNALVLMFNALENLIGAWLYRSRVDSDNYASQGLMKKLGARPNGISEMFLHGDELIRFQEENKDLIDDRIIGVANEFGVAPIDLLGQVLEYRIEWGN
jgi:RimJ/RimL family protein N-acetyltransferase